MMKNNTIHVYLSKKTWFQLVNWTMRYNRNNVENSINNQTPFNFITQSLPLITHLPQKKCRKHCGKSKAKAGNQQTKKQMPLFFSFSKMFSNLYKTNFNDKDIDLFESFHSVNLFILKLTNSRDF